MKRPTKDAPTLTPKKRCAVYTRKSTDEVLDQEYNSLEAQRDSAPAFISSQRHEGSIANDDGYDDGGFSGGNTNRPALKRLLADVEDGRIDVVVVYKIDRLSRSLSDFARMVDLFDARGVTFVSVTQQFNTTTSMGRLTLNILLSFAQFEREVTGERIRDKIAASKAKGMWIGGTPPLGCDVQPTCTQKKRGKRYRYYMPYLEKRQSAGAPYDPTIRNIGSLSALEIEAAVLAQVHKALQQPEMIVGVWRAGMALRERQQMDEPTVLVAMRQMSTVWENLFPIEQTRIMRLLIERVQLHEDDGPGLKAIRQISQ